MVMPETIGGYRILNEIGSGGSGTVYRAYSPSSGRAVALKTLDPKFNDSDVRPGVVIERFRREVLLTSEINHPNVIGILDEGEDGGVHFIVMEMMPLSLRDALSAGSLPMSRALDVCRQAALGLKAAQERDITHRDVTPNNILLDPSGAVKMADFGLARAEDLRAIAEDLRTVTVAGAPIGTPLYRSPEQWRGERADVRSDIFSLGVVLHEMLTGKAPFVITGRTLVKQDRPSVPTNLERIVEKCTQLAPNHRYQTMDELLQEITNSELVNRCVLTDFYEAMGGPNWKRNDNWLTDVPLDEWYGVNGHDDDDPDPYNRVRWHMSPSDAIWALSLEFNDLEGKIPPEIGYMARLRYLDLNSNPGIVGTFPPELWDIEDLDLLDLSNTRLSGTLPPPGLGRWKWQILNYSGDWINEYDVDALYHLNLSNCRFTGDIPVWLPVKEDHDSYRDTSLYLSGNNWTGTEGGTYYWRLVKDSDKIPSLPSLDR